MSILETIDGALRDYEAGGDAMRWVPEEKRLEEDRAAPVADEVIQAFGRAMTQAAEDIQRMFAVLQPVVEAQAKAYVKMGHSLNRYFYPKQHKRCTTCHPWRKPKPLAVNGHEYQRRQRARRRRKR